MRVRIATTQRGRSRRALALLSVCLLLSLQRGFASAASLPSGLRAAAAQAPIDVFVWMRPAPTAYGTQTSRAFAALQRQSLLAAIPLDHVVIRREFRSIPALELNVDAQALDAIASHPDVLAVSPPRYGGAALATSVSQIGATDLHNEGFLGQGTVLALLDTGVDSTHPDIAGRVDAEACVCQGCCPGPSNFAEGPGSADSIAVHGPHVAGIMASAGVVAAEGVAPDAHLVAVRVLDDNNRGNVADWVSALDLILSDHPEVVAVNMSLASDELYTPYCDQSDALTMAFANVVAQLHQQGTLVVAAAGNNGQDSNYVVGTMPAPACVHGVVSVGAVFSFDAIASFSDVAPTLSLLAPGVAITSDAPGGGTATLTGTSMAAPHVTAGAALLLSFVGRPFFTALPGVLRANGLLIADPRLCNSGVCSTFPRVDVKAAADWLTSIATMFPGGGSTALDCQTEWNLSPTPSGNSAKTKYFRCHDGDSTCDTDSVAGQCTFRVQACFNVPDIRLPNCDPQQTVTAFRLLRPRADQPHDATDLQNAIHVLGSLPAMPIDESGRCGTPFDFVVPTGNVRLLMTSTETTRGRDLDRLRFNCEP